jgi:hypothetical protein
MTFLFTKLTEEVDPNQVPATYTVVPKIYVNSAPKG